MGAASSSSDGADANPRPIARPGSRSRPRTARAAASGTSGSKVRGSTAGHDVVDVESAIHDAAEGDWPGRISRVEIRSTPPRADIDGVPQLRAPGGEQRRETLEVIGVEDRRHGRAAGVSVERRPACLLLMAASAPRALLKRTSDKPRKCQRDRGTLRFTVDCGHARGRNTTSGG